MSKILLFLTLVVSHRLSESIEFDNKIAGTPIVECERDYIRVTVPTQKPFKGKIYVKGEYTNNECVRNYASGEQFPRFGSKKTETDSNAPRSRPRQGHKNVGSDSFDDFGSKSSNFNGNSENNKGSFGHSDGLFVQRKNGGFERVPGSNNGDRDNRNDQDSGARRKLAENRGNDREHARERERSKTSATAGEAESFFQSLSANKRPSASRLHNKVFPNADGECPLVCPPCQDCAHVFRQPSGLRYDDDEDLLILGPRKRRTASYGVNDASLDIRLGTCNARRDRSVNPPGIHISFTVVVSFHENFITKVDRAYQIQCSYEEFDRSVTTQIDVSPPPESDLEGTIEPPKCDYRILSPTGEHVNNVQVGQVIQHVWSCNSPNGYDKLNDVYGLLVHNCFIEDGKKNRVQVIDDNGCSLLPEIIGTPEYLKDKLYASISSYGIKFPDHSYIDFQCAIHTCVRGEGLCDGITPPKCGIDRPKRHLDPTWPGNATLQTDEWKLHAQRLTVIDIDNKMTEADMKKFSSPLAAAQTLDLQSATLKLNEFCVSVMGFGVIIALITFLFSVALTVLVGLACMKNATKLYLHRM